MPRTIAEENDDQGLLGRHLPREINDKAELIPDSCRSIACNDCQVLTAPEQRNAYLAKLRWAVKRDGHVIVATFASDGSEQCSSLPAVRYSPEDLQAEFGNTFAVKKHVFERRITPSGSSQNFVHCYFLRRA